MNKKILNDINRFLVKHWDPIGIQDDLGAHDEYYPYVRNIFSIISKSKTYVLLFNYLREIETQKIGLEGNREKTKAVAKALFEIFKPNINN